LSEGILMNGIVAGLKFLSRGFWASLKGSNC
jgi:hypothetical protein